MNTKKTAKKFLLKRGKASLKKERSKYIGLTKANIRITIAEKKKKGKGNTRCWT